MLSGYCVKHWDPAEEPLFVGGSVFDAYSLGKWIYDWTVCVYGVHSVFCDIVGDFWLLLIQLAGRLKWCKLGEVKVKTQLQRQLVWRLVVAGESLWEGVCVLLDICGKAMLSVDTDVSGVEFVECFLGRDRELVIFEELMAGMRNWNFNFSSLCGL